MTVLRQMPIGDLLRAREQWAEIYARSRSYAAMHRLREITAECLRRDCLRKNLRKER